MTGAQVTRRILADALLHAWVGGLGRSLPAGPPAEPVRLDDTGRAPLVRLRPAGGVRA